MYKPQYQKNKDSRYLEILGPETRVLEEGVYWMRAKYHVFIHPVTDENISVFYSVKEVSPE